MSGMRDTPQRGRFVFERIFAERPLNSGVIAANDDEIAGDAAPSGAALEKARRDGFEQGAIHGRDIAFKEAIAAAQQSLETKTAETLSQIELRLGEAMQAQNEAFAAVATDGGRMLHAILERLLPELVRRNEVEEIVGVVRLGLSIACNDPVLEVRVAPNLADRIRQLGERAAKSAGFAGRLDVSGDPEIAPGAVRVRWLHGSAARDPQETLSAIQRLLGSHLAIEAALDPKTQQGDPT